MAERNPSKQRRQARNRAEREARAARSRAANTPVEDRRDAPVEETRADKRRRLRAEAAEKAAAAKGSVVESRAERRERRKRERAAAPEEIEARAREVIEASAVDADEGDAAGASPGSGVAPAPRRGSSPVFSARHRAAVADATADQAPARTHVGVSEATGVEVDGPRVRGRNRPRTAASAQDSGRSRSASSRQSTSRSTASSSRRTTSSTSRTGSTGSRAGSATPPRTSARPPARPMPAWLDRFGGNEPGGRWIMMSFAMVLMATVIINFVHIVPPPPGSVTLSDGSDSVSFSDARVVQEGDTVRIVTGDDAGIDVPVQGKMTHPDLEIGDDGEIGDDKTAIEVTVNTNGNVVVAENTQMYKIWHYGLGPGLYFLLPPVVILGLFILTARPWDRRRSWNIALGCLVFVTFITNSISIYIVPIGALAWGCWQARKAALAEVDGDPRVLREVERERRMAGREALRAARGRRRGSD